MKELWQKSRWIFDTVLGSAIFALGFSTIALMIICATISIAIYSGTRQKGGAAK